jgi:iron complex transport system ATP-binding protein
MQINGARWSMVSIFRSTMERWTPCRRARNGTAVIAILHDLNLAVRFADRIVVIHRGAIAADDVSERTITDDIVRKVFEVDVAIQHHSNGSPLLPQLMRPATNA